MPDDVEIVLDEAAIEHLLADPAGPVGELLAKLGIRTAEGARALAPVGKRDSKVGHPAGYLKSQIGWDLGLDGDGLRVDVESTAKNSPANPFTPGGDYAYWNEVPGSAPNHSSLPRWITEAEHPYLRPALDATMRDV